MYMLRLPGAETVVVPPFSRLRFGNEKRLNVKRIGKKNRSPGGLRFSRVMAGKIILRK